MALVVTIFAAIISTVVWYVGAPITRKFYVGILALMYWGASIMWLADAIMDYSKVGIDYFTPPARDMLNDTYLAVSIIALGLIIWLVILLVRDPKGVIRKMSEDEEE